MMPLVLLLFILTPLIEIWLFLQVREWVGIWPTLGAVVLTAVVGISLLRVQGLSTLLRARARLENQDLPVQEIGEGLLLAIAGAMLLTPGFFLDSLGFLLLVRPLRLTLLRRWILPRLVAVGRYRGGPGDVIEGEFYRNDKNDRIGP